MEEIALSNSEPIHCIEEAEEEVIVRELLDDESPFFLLPNTQTQTLSKSQPQSNTQMANFNALISKVYSGPTLVDIENALSFATPTKYPSQFRNKRVTERCKIENNKYTLKLISSGNGMADDGYKWRKYGQKSIKNSPFPRSYYRCTNPRCSAKKQVEKSSEEEDTVIITYEGLHLHFAFPYINLAQQAQALNPPLKKPKQMEAQKVIEEAHLEDPSCDNQESILCQPQGLLEDVVPIMVRNPSKNSSNSSTSSSYPSPPTSPSSLSWSSINSYSCFDVEIDTMFMLAE